MRVTAFAAATILAVSLAGCTTTSEYENDPLYGDGFSDGCATGTARTPGTPASNPVRDEAAWKESPAYQAGWRRGYAECSPGAAGDIPGRDR